MSSLKENVSNLFQNLISSGMNDKKNIEEIRKIIFCNSIILTGIPFLVTNSIFSFINQNQFRGTIDVTTIIFLIIILIFLRITKQFQTFAAVGILGMTLFFGYLFLNAKSEFDYLWAFTYPLFVIPLMGIKRSFVYIFLYISFVLFVFYNNWITTPAYTTTFQFKYLSSFLIVTLLAYITEFIRAKFERRVRDRNKALQSALDTLKLREQAIRDSEFTCKELVERSREGIVILQDKKIVFLNKSLVDLGGYNMNEIINTTFTQYIAEDKVKEVYANYMLRMANIPVPQVYNTVLYGKNKNRIHTQIHAGRIPYKGKIADLVFVRRIPDINEEANA